MAHALHKRPSVQPIDRRHVLPTLVALALVAAPATARAFALKQTPSGSHVRWQRSVIELELAPTDEGTLRTERVAGALESAAATWSGVPGVPLLHVRTGTSARWGNDGVNGVYVLARWPFEDRRLAVTVSSYREGTGELVDTDVLVNGEMAFGVTDECAADRFDLSVVLTHELGHVLGLDESEVFGATMWPNTRMGETARRELSVDDVDGVLALYGGAPTPSAVRYGCSITIDGTARRPNGSGAVWVLFGLGLFGIGRRRHARS